MLTRCPKCRSVHLADPAEGEESAAEFCRTQIVEFCDANGISAAADGTVTEREAGLILGRSPFTLRNARLGRRPIPFLLVQGRVRYRINDLARHLARNTDRDPY